jgi:hypothetical protein
MLGKPWVQVDQVHFGEPKQLKLLEDKNRETPQQPQEKKKPSL